MASNTKTSYTIELDIAKGDRTRATVDAIERGIKNITDASKSGDLSKGMADATKAAEALEKQIKDIVSGSEDATAEIKAFDKASTKAISDLEKQAVALNHALSEQGKQQRARISEIEEELSKLSNSNKEKAKRKQLENELKTLQKDIVRGSDEELQKALKENQTIRARLRLTQTELRLQQTQKKESKTLSQLIINDLSQLKEKIRLQTEFIRQLKTTEGRYLAIKKAAGTVARGAAKAAGAIGLGVGGTAMAMMGAAMAGAQGEVARESEARRIRASLSDDDKKSLLGELYMARGGDYSSIVDAINRVTSVLGAGAGKSELMQATTAELAYPGITAVLRQQNTGGVTAGLYSELAGQWRAIQSATGASVEQLTQNAGLIANRRASDFSGARQTELLAVRAQLQTSGAFDSEEELQRAFNRFVRAQKTSKKSPFELAQEWSTSGQWEKTAYGQTNRQQARVLRGIDWGTLASATRTTGGIQETDAEKTARKMREIEEKKNQILGKMIEALAPVFEEIDVQQLSEFIKTIITDLAPAISKIAKFTSETIGSLVETIQEFIETLRNSKIGELMGIQATPQLAAGGVTSMPSLCGERGPEAVIPLGYDRSARAGNIMQNISQTFNMAGNETTALSLSKAVQSRAFTRALSNANSLSARLGR